MKYQIVPVEPTEELLTSMAVRHDHGLGVPGYYDQEMFRGSHPNGHADYLEFTKRNMRQLHEEVVGTGFYKASPPAPSVEEIKAALKPFANFACEPIGWCQDHGGMCNNCKVAALLAQFEAMESREGK